MSSSEEDSEEGSLPGNTDEADDDIGSLDREANFLLKTVSRFVRTVFASITELSIDCCVFFVNVQVFIHGSDRFKFPC